MSFCMNPLLGTNPGDYMASWGEGVSGWPGTLYAELIQVLLPMMLSQFFLSPHRHCSLIGFNPDMRVRVRGTSSHEYSSTQRRASSLQDMSFLTVIPLFVNLRGYHTVSSQGNATVLFHGSWLGQVDSCHPWAERAAWSDCVCLPPSNCPEASE